MDGHRLVSGYKASLDANQIPITLIDHIEITPDTDETQRDRELLQVEGRGSYVLADGLTITGGGEIRWEQLSGDELVGTTASDVSDRIKAVFGKQRPYTALSGGERQLVLIGRALVQGADIFIMDEPINGLDYGNQIRLLGRVADLARDGYTFIKTTHFPDHAPWVSDRVVADGKTANVITRTNLYRLYNTQVNVLDLDEGCRICVPEALRQVRNPAPAVRRAFAG